MGVPASRPEIRPFDTKNPFDVYVVGLEQDGQVSLVDAIYDSEELAMAHRIGLKSLPQYKDVEVIIKKIPQVTTLEQIKDEFQLESTGVIAQIVGLPPHAFSSLGPMF